MTSILVIGSTGKLGTKLLKFCYTHKIKISALSCFKNLKKIKKQSKTHNSKYFLLNDKNDKLKFINYISKNKFDLVYFLDFGSYSLYYLNLLLRKNNNTTFAIANKELLIAGGSFLLKKIKQTKNKFIPLDSEHFSLIKSGINNNNIKKIYITASGGPFYYKPNIDLNKVKLFEVLNHPKWKMGVNNLIDSSNFINKLLEIYELSIIFNIDLDKIDFLISQNAFVHSVIIYFDNTISVNCFNNDMLITLTNPLHLFYKFNSNSFMKKKLFDVNNFKLEIFNDKRFMITKYLKLLKNFNHFQQIEFMILNNIAQKKYLNQEIKYNDIIKFIMNNISLNINSDKLKSIKQILDFIDYSKLKHENK